MILGLVIAGFIGLASFTFQIRDVKKYPNHSVKKAMVNVWIEKPRLVPPWEE